MDWHGPWSELRATWLGAVVRATPSHDTSSPSSSPCPSHWSSPSAAAVSTVFGHAWARRWVEVQAALDAGFPVNRREDEDDAEAPTLLQLAIRGDSAAMVGDLLQRGAHLLAKVRREALATTLTPCTFGVQELCPPSLQPMCCHALRGFSEPQSEADPFVTPYQKQTTDGYSPFFTAFCLGRAAICRLLATAGADVNACNADGVSPLLYLLRAHVVRNNDPDMLQVCESVGCAFIEGGGGTSVSALVLARGGREAHPQSVHLGPVWVCMRMCWI